MKVQKVLMELEQTRERPPQGLYETITELTGKYILSSGTGCHSALNPIMQGKLGGTVTTEEGQRAARQCMLNVLANAKSFLGDIHKIKRAVKTTVFIASESDFQEHSKVADGASQVLIDLLGPNNEGVRTAIGVSSLPQNQAVEIEVIFELY